MNMVAAVNIDGGIPVSSGREHAVWRLFDLAEKYIAKPAKTLSVILAGTMLLAHVTALPLLLGASLASLGILMIGLAAFNIGFNILKKIKHGQKVNLLNDMVLPLTLMAGGTALGLAGLDSMRWLWSLGLSSIAVGSWFINAAKGKFDATSSVSALISAGWALVAGDAYFNQGQHLETFQKQAYHTADPYFQNLFGVTMTEWVTYNTYATLMERFPELEGKVKLVVIGSDPAQNQAALDQALKELGDQNPNGTIDGKSKADFLASVADNDAYRLAAGKDGWVIVINPADGNMSSESLMTTRMTMLHEYGHVLDEVYNPDSPNGGLPSGARESAAEIFSYMMAAELYPGMRDFLLDRLAERILMETSSPSHRMALESILMLETFGKIDTSNMSPETMAKIAGAIMQDTRSLDMLEARAFDSNSAEMFQTFSDILKEKLGNSGLSDAEVKRIFFSSIAPGYIDNMIAHGTPAEKAEALAIRDAWIAFAEQSGDQRVVWAVENVFNIDLPGEASYNPNIIPTALAGRIEAAVNRMIDAYPPEYRQDYLESREYREMREFCAMLRGMDSQQPKGVYDLLMLQLPGHSPRQPLTVSTSTPG